jgi:hypothetical protein
MSLFDSPKPFLNPKIWTPEKKVRPEVREFIFSLIQTVLPMDKIFAMDLLGSNVGYQYGDTSDIDVNVVARKGESFDQWHKTFKIFNKKEHLLPGTKHPVNFFFQEYDPNRNWENSLGAYDLIGDRWVKNPIPFDEIGDPETKYEREIAYGKMILQMIETQVSRAKEANARGDKDTARRIYTELAILFKQIEDNRKTAYRYGTGTPALQEYNIMYKLIDSSMYNDLFKKLVDYYDSEINPIEPKASET